MDVPNLALTATATKKIQDEVFELLGFQREQIKVIAAFPKRYCTFIICFTFMFTYMYRYRNYKFEYVALLF